MPSLNEPSAFRIAHACLANKSLCIRQNRFIHKRVEAMHLLPCRFELQALLSSSQGRLRERQHSSSQLLFGFFREPAAPPPAAGFFVFGASGITSMYCREGEGLIWSVVTRRKLEDANVDAAENDLSLIALMRCCLAIKATPDRLQIDARGDTES
jgi:hypothetical protein